MNMKKIILLILFSLISFISSAQFVQSPSQELRSTSEYIEGRRLINTGAIYFGACLVTETIGVGLVIAGPVEKTIVDAATSTIYQYIDDRPVIIGYGLMGVSAILGGIGIYKMVKGTNKIKNAKFDYAIRNGALIVSF